MNLITFDKMEPENGYMLLRDFRKEDNNKILILLSDMLKKLKSLFSKLPIRQITATREMTETISVSKLPIRQITSCIRS